MARELLSLAMEHQRELSMDYHSVGDAECDLSTQFFPIISKRPNIHVTQFCRTPNWLFPPVTSKLTISTLYILIDDSFELHSHLGRYGLSNTCRSFCAATASLHTSRFNCPFFIMAMADGQRIARDIIFRCLARHQVYT